LRGAFGWAVGVGGWGERENQQEKRMPERPATGPGRDGKCEGVAHELAGGGGAEDALTGGGAGQRARIIQ